MDEHEQRVQRIMTNTPMTRDEAEGWLDRVESPRLLIIDTMQKVRPGGELAKLTRYEQDYAVGEALTRLTRRGLAVLIVHHTRKAEAEDPVDLVSGTLGLSGGMDGIMVLTRSRAQYDAELFVTGRDIEDETTYALKFTPKAGAWSLLGRAEQQPGGREQEHILEALRRLGPSKPATVAKHIDKSASTVRTLISRMVERGALTRRFDGKYEPSTPSTPSTVGVDAYPRSIPVDSVDAVDALPSGQQQRGVSPSTPSTPTVDAETDSDDTEIDL